MDKKQENPSLFSDVSFIVRKNRLSSFTEVERIDIQRKYPIIITLKSRYDV